MQESHNSKNYLCRIVGNRNNNIYRAQVGSSSNYVFWNQVVVVFLLLHGKSSCGCTKCSYGLGPPSVSHYVFVWSNRLCLKMSERQTLLLHGVGGGAIYQVL